MPSFINKLMLDEVKGLVGGAASLIVLDSSKLNSSDSLQLRKDLRGVGAKLKVAKVAIIKRSVPEAAAKLCDGKCSIGVILAPDMIGAAKVLAELTKAEKVSVKGGLMDGAALDPAGIKRLADMPSKQTLRGMLVNILAAPLTGLARVIAEIEKKKNPGAPAA